VFGLKALGNYQEQHVHWYYVEHESIASPGENKEGNPQSSDGAI